MLSAVTLTQEKGPKQSNLNSLLYFWPSLWLAWTEIVSYTGHRSSRGNTKASGELLNAVRVKMTKADRSREKVGEGEVPRQQKAEELCNQR